MSAIIKSGKHPAAPAKKHKPRKQNKPSGHFCYVCGEHKANEVFSSRGHANDNCKQCQALPAAKRSEMVAVRKLDNMAFRYLSNTEINWLRKKMNNPRPEARDAVQTAYGIKFSSHDREMAKATQLKTPVLFSELDDEQKADVMERLEELIGDFFECVDIIPDDEDRGEILAELCEEMPEILNWWKPESEKELVADDELKAAFNEIVDQFLADLKADGIELPTFKETLLVVETERLQIRRFYKADLIPLWEIMKKSEVMYAWENGFKKSEARKWLNRQYTRYHEDGYGYFAVIMKDTGRLIGQAGLMKSDLNGDSVVEIGYIFDDTVWGNGYATEAARACVDLAFHRFGIDRLYVTVRPANAASVKLAEKLGMQKTGEYVKTYQGKEMPHDVYEMKNGFVSQ